MPPTVASRIAGLPAVEQLAWQIEAHWPGAGGGARRHWSQYGGLDARRVIHRNRTVGKRINFSPRSARLISARRWPTRSSDDVRIFWSMFPVGCGLLWKHNAAALNDLTTRRSCTIRIVTA